MLQNRSWYFCSNITNPRILLQEPGSVSVFTHPLQHKFGPLRRFLPVDEELGVFLVDGFGLSVPDHFVQKVNSCISIELPVDLCVGEQGAFGVCIDGEHVLPVPFAVFPYELSPELRLLFPGAFHRLQREIRRIPMEIREGIRRHPPVPEDLALRVRLRRCSRGRRRSEGVSSRFVFLGWAGPFSIRFHRFQSEGLDQEMVRSDRIRGRDEDDRSRIVRNRPDHGVRAESDDGERSGSGDGERYVGIGKFRTRCSTRGGRKRNERKGGPWLTARRNGKPVETRPCRPPGITNVVKDMVESAEETFEELRLSQHKLTSSLNNLKQALDALAAEVPDFPKIDAHNRTLALQKRVSALQDKVEQVKVKIRRIEFRLSQLEGDT